MHILGTNGDDKLFGTSGDDIMEAFQGNDTFFGSEGADRIEGGEGIDWMDYSASTAAVQAHLRTTTDVVGQLSSGGLAEGDLLRDIENMRGSSFDDYITGSTQANILLGGLGDDRLFGLDGNDTLYGEAGEDSLKGGNQDDILFGGKNDDALMGGSGNDTLKGGDDMDWLDGGSGADVIDGGAHFDFLSYGSSLSAVKVDLSTGRVAGGTAQGDTLMSIEGIVGSEYSDRLAGDSGANVLYGEGGADILIGGAGDDVLDSGLESLSGRDDTMTGGTGADTFVYYWVERGMSLLGSGWSGYDVITDFEAGVDRIIIKGMPEEMQKALAEDPGSAMVGNLTSPIDFQVTTLSNGDMLLF